MTTLSTLIDSYLATLDQQYRDTLAEIEVNKAADVPTDNFIGQRYGFLCAIQGIDTFNQRFEAEWTLVAVDIFDARTSGLEEDYIEAHIQEHMTLPDDPQYFNRWVDMLSSPLRHYIEDRAFLAESMARVGEEFPSIVEADLKSGMDTFFEFNNAIKPDIIRQFSLPPQTPQINSDIRLDLGEP